MKKLVLIDGSSYLFRAYYALPPLSNSKGQSTGAIFGVIKMLQSIYDFEKPDYFAVIFDDKGKTFRHEMYPDYKANRQAMPEELAAQIAPLHHIIKAMGFPLLIYPTVEADDVIATLACQADAQNIETIVSTGDKDLAQLVNHNISLINTMNNDFLDEEGVKNKFMVKPEQIVDYLSLVGDSSDNIRGVDKVGPKTAAKWLNEYHDLDAIIANADNIKGKVGDNLKTALERLELNRRLITLDKNLQLKEAPQQLLKAKTDNRRLFTLYSELEFKALRDSLTSDKTDNDQGKYQTITDQAELNKWLKLMKTAKLLVLDTETTSLDISEAELVGLSFCVTAGVAIYLPLKHDAPDDEDVASQLDYQITLAQLKPILEDSDIAKAGQNLKYDCSVLVKAGIKLQGIKHDTMLMSYVLNSVSANHDLDSMAQRLLSYQTIKYSDVAGVGKKQLIFNQINIAKAAPYASEDADIVMRLYQHLAPQLGAEPTLKKLYQEVEIPLVPVIAKIERNGVLINQPKLEQMSREFADKIHELEQQAYEVAGHKFNLASPKQIQEILFTELEIPVIRKTPKGQPSTAEGVLKELSQDYDLPQIILNHRELSKLKSTYTDKLPTRISPLTGRIHTSYHQAGTITGRLSSSDPNLQNIPARSQIGRKIRSAFIAADQHLLISADYSQIELRIMAHLSQDESLLQAFANDMDIHLNTAAEVFGCAPDKVTNTMRSHAKAVNFGLIYGMSAFGLAKQLGIERTVAQEYIDLYFTRYPKVKQYMQQTRDDAKKNGFVETVYGRRLYLPDIKAKNARRRQYAERTAINAPMQGTAADIIKIAMVKMQHKIDQQHPESLIIMQVHDELVLEVPQEKARQVAETLQQEMEQAVKLSVALKVEVGIADNWEDAH